MPCVFEFAPSGRSKCRGCGQPIARDALRFGERLPNPFGGGEMTLWFHPACAAFKRPEPLLQALAETAESVLDRQGLERAVRAGLERAARAGLVHPRLQRIDGAERSPSAQAKCRSCHQPIERGTWRIRLVFFDEGGLFSAGGYLHLACRKAYFETNDVLEHLLHFSPALSDDEREELRRACATDPAGATLAQS